MTPTPDGMPAAAPARRSFGPVTGPAAVVAGVALASAVLAAGGATAWYLSRPRVPPEFRLDHPRFAAIEPALADASRVTLVGAHQGPEGGPLIILAGENHAQGATQAQVAEWISGVLPDGRIDAVLLEGSEGPLDWEASAREVATVLGDTAAGVFWRSRLDAGAISGVEFAYLAARPEVELLGVEDVELKNQWGSESPWGDEVQRREADAEEDRLIAILRAAYAKAPAGEAAKTASIALDALGQASARSREARDAAAGAYPRAVKLQAQLQSKAEAHDALVVEFNSRVQGMIADSDSFNSRVEGYNRRAGRGEAEPHEYQRLGRDQAELSRRAEALAADRARVEALAGEVKGIQREMDEAARPVEAYSEVNRAADRALFVAANAVAVAAGPGSEVHRAFTELARGAALDREAYPSLGPRDDAMVEKSKAWWSGRKDAAAVMLVGYAHLPSLRSRLEKAGASYVALRFRSAEEPSSAVDLAAWTARLEKTDPEGRKELSWFTPALAKAFREESLFLARTGQDLLARLPAGEAAAAFEEGGREWFVLRRPPGGSPPMEWHGAANSETFALPASDGTWVDFIARDGTALRERLGSLGDDSTSFIDVSRSGNSIQYALPSGSGSRPATVAEVAEYIKSDASAARQFVLLRSPGVDEEDMKDVAYALGGGKLPPNGPNDWGRRIHWAEDPNRARRNLNVLRERDGKDDRTLVVVVDPRLSPSDTSFNINLDTTRLEGASRVALAPSIQAIPWSPPDGSMTDTVMIVGRNDDQLQQAIRAAAANRKLENKEVVLVTCGGVGRQIDSMSAVLRAGGAVGIVIFREDLDGEQVQNLADELADRSNQLNRGTPGWVIVQDAIDAIVGAPVQFERHVFRSGARATEASRG